MTRRQRQHDGVGLPTPGRERFLLTIDSRTGQFHTQYTARQDLGRTAMTLRMLEARVEPLTFGIESSTTGKGGRLTLSWDVASTPFRCQLAHSALKALPCAHRRRAIRTTVSY